MNSRFPRKQTTFFLHTSNTTMVDAIGELFVAVIVLIISEVRCSGEVGDRSQPAPVFVQSIVSKSGLL